MKHRAKRKKHKPKGHHRKSSGKHHRKPPPYHSRAPPLSVLNIQKKSKRTAIKVYIVAAAITTMVPAHAARIILKKTIFAKLF